MPSIESAVFARATTHAGLFALIATRCYPDVAPQEPTADYLTYTTASKDRSFRAFARRAQIITARMQIDAYATTKPALVTLTAEVVDAFDVQQGTWGGLVVQESTVDNEQSNVDGLDTEGQFYRQTIDVLITYENPNPSA